MKGNVAAIVLIVLGVFFLLTNLGLISISLRELLRVWWPVALIAVGVALFFTPGGKGRTTVRRICEVPKMKFTSVLGILQISIYGYNLHLYCRKILV